MRRLLAIGASTVLAGLVFGYLVYLPAVSRWFDDSTRAGIMRISAVLLAVAIGSFLCWFAAARHAWLRGNKALAVLLAFSNFVGGCLYYFGYVLWHPDEQLKLPATPSTLVE